MAFFFNTINYRMFGFQRKQILFFVFAAVLAGAGLFAQGLQEPREPQEAKGAKKLYNQMVDSGFGEWRNHYFTFSAKGKLILHEPGEDGFSKKEVYTFPLEPDHVKHFRMADVGIFAAWSNKSHALVIVVLDQEWKVIRSETHKLSRTVLDVDLRVDLARRLVISLVEAEQRKHYLTLKFDGRTHELTIQENPIQATTLDWPAYSIHYVYKEEIKTYWSIWEKGRFVSYTLPFSLGVAAFIKRKGKIYLLGTDANNHLYIFSITPTGGVKPFRLFTNKRGVPIDEMVTTRIARGLQVFLVSSKMKRLFRFEVDPAFLAGEVVPDQRKLLAEGSVSIGDLKGQAVWVEMNALGNSYMRYWKDSFAPVLGFDWKINVQGGVTTIYLSWENSKDASYEYRYMFDQNHSSKPLPDYNDIPRRSATFTLRQEGDYVFHLQGRDKKTLRESPVYHLPVFYQFTPDAPEVELLNEISPRVITGNRLEFLIQNYGPYTYYAEIDKIPVKDPAKKLQNRGGYGRLRHRFEAGRYYLHLRCRDERTGNFSPTVHHLFFHETMAMEQAAGIQEYNKNMSELREVLRMLEKTRNDPEENKKWRKKLQELRERLQGSKVITE